MEDFVESTEILQWRGPRWAASVKHAPYYLMRLQSSSTAYQDSKLKCEVSVQQLLRLYENAFLRIIDSENCCHAHAPSHTPLSQSRTAAVSLNADIDHPLTLSPLVRVPFAGRRSRGKLSSFPSGRSCDCDDSSPQPCITAPLDV